MSRRTAGDASGCGYEFEFAVAEGGLPSVPARPQPHVNALTTDLFDGVRGTRCHAKHPAAWKI